MAAAPYANEVLENKITSILNTRIDMNQYLTPDYSLAEEAGMIKRVNVYTASGSVEDLTKGNGNTGDISVAYVSTPHTVGVTQGRFPYYDEDAMADPSMIDAGIRALTELMTNDLNSKAIAALEGATTHVTYSNTWTFANVVDAVAAYPYEDKSGLFLLINPAQEAALRKNLATQLSYSEAFVRTGYIGSVCGVPVIVSKAVTAGIAVLATKEAVTCFVKKGVEIEQDREPNTRKNTVYARKTMLVALTDASRVVVLKAAAN